MKPKWLIEDFAQDNKFDELAAEVKRQGMTCEIIKYIPFQSGSYNVYPNIQECVIVQASLQLARQLLREKKWVPNCWLNLKMYECMSYYAHLGKFLFNNDYIMLPIGDVVRRILHFQLSEDELFPMYDAIFIRPSSGFKTFTGQVFIKNTFEKDWDCALSFANADLDQIVVISSPKNIKAEWRFIVAREKIITGSLYKINGQSQYQEVRSDSLAWTKAQEIANVKYNPDPVYTIDVCQDEDDDYWLLEIGSFSCAGLYGCNMAAIVENVSAIAVEEYEDYYNKCF